MVSRNSNKKSILACGTHFHTSQFRKYVSCEMNACTRICIGRQTTNLSIFDFRSSIQCIVACKRLTRCCKREKRRCNNFIMLSFRGRMTACHELSQVKTPTSEPHYLLRFRVIFDFRDINLECTPLLWQVFHLLTKKRNDPLVNYGNLPHLKFKITVVPVLVWYDLVNTRAPPERHNS